MPVYEYRCTQCQKVFEYQQRMADAARTECEECKGALERLISRSSFSFKGGGWYKDLYASTKPEAAPSGDGGATTSTPAASPTATPSSTTPAATPSSTPSAAPSTTPSGGGSGSGSGSGGGSGSGSTSSSAV